MKKLAILTVAAMLVFSLAGQAAAYFSDLTLIRVVYHSGGTYEVATDLQINPATLTETTPLSLVVGGGGDAFLLSQFPGAEWADLNVAYFAKSSASQDIWASGLDAGLTSGSRKWSTTSGAIDGFFAYYTSFGDASPTGDQSSNQSYFTLLDKAGLDIGALAGFVSAGTIESNLAGLETAGFVDQKLFFFDSPNSAESGVKTAMLRTMADGSTVINPVPIPGSVLLLGSGLLALVGVRRRRG